MDTGGGPTVNTAIVVVLIVVVLAAIGVGFWFASRRRRSAELREHFGPEYDRAIDEYGAAGPAERALNERSERVEQLHIHPLSAEQRTRYATDWRAVQAQFVDDPEAAIGQADRLDCHGDADPWLPDGRFRAARD